MAIPISSAFSKETQGGREVGGRGGRRKEGGSAEKEEEGKRGGEEGQNEKEKLKRETAVLEICERWERESTNEKAS